MAAQSLHLTWFNPVCIAFGVGCTQQLCDQLALPQAGPGAVVVLADRAAVSAALEAQLRQALGGRCLGWQWTLPGLASVAQAQHLCSQLWPVMQAHPDALVLAIGGGSAMDLSKVLRYRFVQPDALQWQSHWCANTLPEHARHPLWLVPTTSGTGSEVTPWATLWYTEADVPVKRSWSPPGGFAESAWIDPELTRTCPAPLTRDCALDTLAHALESIWNHAANAVTAALAVDAARAVLQALPVVIAAPKNLPAREALSRASLLGGLAMSQTKTALAHALSYEVTLREGMAHGQACAIWLPMVWELACGRSPQCDQSLAQIFEVPPPQGAQRLRQWLVSLGVSPRDLRHNDAGNATLTSTMQSDRGRNFIGT